jgi:rRNA small subunit pseudouridine methyltransferase Nep1
MRMITLVLVESSLSRLPDWARRKDVISNYKKVYGKPYDVLDVNAIPPRMRKMVGEKEGRPDIVHRALLSITDHPLYSMGRISLYMHTVEERIFSFSPSIRPPRNYLRFLGLMTELLREGWVGESRETALIREVDLTLEEIADGSILLDESGEFLNPISFLKSLNEGKFIVGCFPHGEFSEKVERLAKFKLSLHRGTLSSSAAISMLLSYAYYKEVWDP